MAGAYPAQSESPTARFSRSSLTRPGKIPVSYASCSTFITRTAAPYRHCSGDFRFSVSSDDPNAFVREDGTLRNAKKISDPWAKLGAAYILAGDTQRAADLLVKSGGRARIASWLESGMSIDEVFDSMQARYPEKFATLSQDSATAAAERGQIDPARTLYAEARQVAADEWAVEGTDRSAPTGHARRLEFRQWRGTVGKCQSMRTLGEGRRSNRANDRWRSLFLDADRRSRRAARPSCCGIAPTGHSRCNSTGPILPAVRMTPVMEITRSRPRRACGGKRSSPSRRRGR